MATRLLLILSISVILGGCITETYTSGAMVWVDGISEEGGPEMEVSPPPDMVGGGQATEGPPPRAEPEPEPEPVRKPVDPASVVSISEETFDEMIGLISRPQCILADRIEVDATRIPFKPTMIPVADPSYVETADVKNAEGDTQGFVLRSLTGEGLVQRECPHLRIGDGIDCLATRQIRVRYHPAESMQRPVFLRIRALGNAVYRDEETGKRIARDAITLLAELVQGPGGLVLRHSVE